jgi:large subunit ribosomal protein L4
VKATIKDIKNKGVGEIDLSDEVFAARENVPLLYEVVKMQLASRRAGTAATKNRGMMSGTTAKMYRQKGTGRARHGSYKANIFVGGGKAFGPHPRDYGYKVPKKARRGGVRTALSIKAREDKLVILDAFPMPKVRTKDAAMKLKQLGVADALIVMNDRDENLEKSVRNINGVKLIRVEGLNVYDIMRYEHTVILKDALERVQEVLKP